MNLVILKINIQRILFDIFHYKYYIIFIMKNKMKISNKELVDSVIKDVNKKIMKVQWNNILKKIKYLLGIKIQK